MKRMATAAAVSLLLGLVIGFTIGELRIGPFRDAAEETARLKARNAQLEEAVRSQVVRIGALSVSLKKAQDELDSR